MEPHREEPQRAPPPSAEQKPKRFRIVKLEERIAPRNHKGTQAGVTCPCTNLCTGGNMCTFSCVPCGY
jgi:hypothetical protein